MAYPPRVCIAGATYLIRTKCINSEPRLKIPDLKDVVITCISDTMTKYSFSVSFFLIEDFQITMVIRTTNDRDTVSKILQHLKSNITRRINRKTFRTGTIWNERFSSTIIESVKDSVSSFLSQLFPSSNSSKHFFRLHGKDFRQMMNIFGETKKNE